MILQVLQDLRVQYLTTPQRRVPIGLHGTHQPASLGQRAFLGRQKGEETMISRAHIPWHS